MAIGYTTLSFINASESPSPIRGRVLTIGRQNTAAVLAKVTGEPFCEQMLKRFGAATVESIDYSDYEGATHVADLNRPVDPVKFHEKFDTIIDGGTLEHIFNTPQVLTNYSNMLAPGGKLFLSVPCDSHVGHGFYQFSPVLFSQLYAGLTHFQVNRIWLNQIGPFTRFYEVALPIRSRVELASWRPVLINVEITKIQAGIIWVGDFKVQQPDYIDAWSQGKEYKLAPYKGMLNTIFRYLFCFTLRNKKMFRKITNVLP